MVSADLDRRGRYDRALSPGQRAARQREQILWAALEVLDERGSSQLTVEPVVKRARVGRNTFYAHFDDVGDLLGGVREWAADRLFDVMSEVEEPSFTPLERLRALAHAWVAAIEREPRIARAVLSHVVGIDARHLGSRAGQRLVRRLAQIAEDAVRDGLMSSPPSETTLVALAGSFLSVGTWQCGNRGGERSEMVEGLSALAVRAIR